MEQQNTKNNFIKETIKFILIVALIVIPIRTFIAQPFIVSGASMDPTFATGHYLIIDELSYHFKNPARGEVIILRYPKQPKIDFIKRIIGLPGETIDIKDGKVTITRPDKTISILKDDFIDPKNAMGDSYHTKLLDNEYFVMGDNRAQSSDSRSWGPVTRNLIVGRAWLRLFPFTKIGFFPGKVNF